MLTPQIWHASASSPCRRKAPHEALAEELRAARVVPEAVTVDYQRLIGASDRHLSGVCKDEGRIFVTLELDFADIRTYPPDEYPRLIVLRLFRQDKLHVVDMFRRTLKAIEHGSLAGRI